MNSYKKVKPAAKVVISENAKIQTKVLETMKAIADTVGATLGPSGRPVLIERQEYGLPNILTKDGVTVFRNLGFRDPTAQAIMESARDAANRTVVEAGDGTTTATVLAYALVRNLIRFCEDNPKYTPQKIVREIEFYFKHMVEPSVKKWAITQEVFEGDFAQMLKDVATISANGDVELANVVMKCFDLTGDKGAIVVSEQSGPSGYNVEHIEGFPIEVGYEESLGRYQSLYINDKANNRVYIENPVFILSQAPVTEIQSVQLLLEQIGKAWGDSINSEKEFSHNVVLVAPSFSDSLVGALGGNWQASDTINVIPMVCPKTIIQNSEIHFIDDLASVTGATVFNPITKPINSGTLNDVGYGIKSFEMSRFRSMIVGVCERGLVKMQSQTLSDSLSKAESKLDAQIIEDRIARLNGGICKLKIVGPSSGEIRERRDRAEDAIAAVRGAIKHGFLPGACSTLLKLASQLPETPVFQHVIKPALEFPFLKILNNCGYTEDESELILKDYYEKLDTHVFDAMNGKFEEPFSIGLLDSVPAVLESIRNSFSIASILGTMGGTIVFERDDFLEREEASQVNHYLQSTGLEGKL